MLSGFNTNIRYRGVRFHVQTEDSGLAHPHVITHLYYQGTIVASEKRDYAERVGSAELEAELRRLMEGQHAGMLQRLRCGELDAVIEERLGAQLLQSEAESGAEPAAACADSTPEQRPQPSAAPAPATSAPPVAAAGADARPLDELILDYLVESARKRKRRVQ